MYEDTKMIMEELAKIQRHLDEMEARETVMEKSYFELKRTILESVIYKQELELMKVNILSLERSIREIKAKMQVA